MKFFVGDLHETFGFPTADSVETVLRFTQDSNLVSLTGLTGFSGIKAVKLASLNKECITLED